MSRPSLTSLGWRFLGLFACVCVLTLRLDAGPPNAPSAPDYAQIGLPDAAGAAAFLDRFRLSRSTTDTYLEFDLHALPRRGAEVIYKGRFWTGRDDTGPVTRIVVTDTDGARHAVLFQSSPAGGVWTVGPSGVAASGVAALFTPLVPGVDMTAFDLQMPFFYWPSATLIRVTRLRGRPAYLFVFKPPASFAAAHPELSGVRAYLDTDYAVPVQTELFGPSGQSTKTFSLVDIKKVGEMWTVKEFDVRNEATRDKSRFDVTGIASGDFRNNEIFQPDRLSEDLPVPNRDRFVKIDP